MGIDKTSALPFALESPCTWEDSFNISFGEAVQASGFGRCRAWKVAGFQHTDSDNTTSSCSFLVWCSWQKSKGKWSFLSFPPSLKSRRTTRPWTWVFHFYQIPWSGGVTSWNWFIHCKTGSFSFHFLICFCPRREDDQETPYYSKLPLKIENACFPNLE